MISEMRRNTIVILLIRCPKAGFFSNHRPSFRQPSLFDHSCHLPLLPCRSKSSTTRRRVAYGSKKNLPGKSLENSRDNAGNSLLNKITEIVKVGVDSSRPLVPAEFDGSKVGLGGRKGVRRNARQSTILVNREVPISEDLAVTGEMKDSQPTIEASLLDGTRSLKDDAENEESSILERPMLEGVLAGNLIEEDVSPVVHRITEIVRFDSLGIGMEERLQESGVTIDPNIVEKVLKRCFKVRNLAKRFFYWSKLYCDFHHTTETYNVMIYIAGEGKDFDLVEKLVLEMEKDSCPKNIKTWSIIVSQYGKAKKIGKALKVFEDMRKSGCNPDVRLFEAVIRMLCQSRKGELALEFYYDMMKKGMEVSIDLFEFLMCCLSRNGDITAVRLLRDDMMRTYGESEVFSCVLRSFCKSRRIDDAQDLIIEMKEKSFKIGPGDLRILWKSLYQEGRSAEAVEVLDHMKKQNMFIDNEDYGFVIYRLLKEGDITKANEIFYEMKKEGLLPTITTYTQLIRHFLKSARYDDACDLYKEMLENNTQPDLVTLTIMLAGHIRNNNISEAFNLLKECVDCSKYKLEVYSLFIKELCIASRSEEAFKFIMELSNSNIKLNVKTIQLVIASLSREGHLDKARKMKDMSRFVELREQSLSSEITTDFQASHYESKVSCCSVHPEQISSEKMNGNGNLNEVYRILSSSSDWSLMQDELEKSFTNFTPELVLKILHHFRREGRIALQFFSWVKMIPGFTQTTETYNMAMKIAGGAKDFKHMRNLYLEMRRMRCFITPDTWTIMIFQYGKAGLTRMALEKFKEMKYHGHQPNRSTYKFLIIFVCGKKGRNIDAGVYLFKEMISAGHFPDNEMVGVYLSCLCESGNYSEARTSVELLQKCGFTKQASYSLLIRSFCRAGRLEEALALTNEMDLLGCKTDEYIYGSLVHGLLSAGRLNEALTKIKDMNRADIPSTAHIYTSFIVHYFKEKQIDKAIETFKTMIDANFRPTVVTYSAMIRGYMNAGMIADAWNAFLQMRAEDISPDFKFYSMFITCLCNAGRSEEGMSLLNDMSGNGIFPSCINFRTVFYGFNREGKQDLAHSVLQMKWSLSRKRKFTT